MHGVDIHRGTPRRSHLSALVVGFGVLYSLTATWGYEANVDAIAAALPAWSLVERGTLELGQFADLNPWIVEGTSGYVSNRPPGTFVIAIPGYLVAQSDVFSNGPATATAVLATVAALCVMYFVLCRVVPERTALLGSLIIGLGTSTWQISGDALWPHGPGQFWAALGLLAVANGRYVRSGWMFAIALLTRPITAVSTAALALGQSWRTRSTRPTVAIGIPTALAFAALLTYNVIVFGELSVVGGYGDGLVENVTNRGIIDHFVNFLGFFFAPYTGLYVYSPVLLVATVGTALAWRGLPDWVRSAAVAAIAYLAVHSLLNRASGGLQYGYRYPLEPLVLAAPGLTLGTLRLASRSRVLKLATLASIALSVAIQVLLVWFLECESGDSIVTCSLLGL